MNTNKQFGVVVTPGSFSGGVLTKARMTVLGEVVAISQGVSRNTFQAFVTVGLVHGAGKRTNVVFYDDNIAKAQVEKIAIGNIVEAQGEILQNAVTTRSSFAADPSCNGESYEILAPTKAAWLASQNPAPTAATPQPTSTKKDNQPELTGASK